MHPLTLPLCSDSSPCLAHDSKDFGFWRRAYDGPFEPHPLLLFRQYDWMALWRVGQSMDSEGSIRAAICVPNKTF